MTDYNLARWKWDRNAMATDLRKQFTANTQPGPFYADDVAGSPLDAAPILRMIAFYLPQFHRISENDKWWGKGFTEWTNVTKALPRFSGHYQPRLPADLGFYDLANPDTLQRQAVLARRYGIHGFCFHHYWFSGQRILERPLEMLIARPDIDLPFCVNWANENWSRRWDGYDQDVLLAQRHSPEDDIAFARSLEPLFRDPRYIRIQGRPLLMLYRPGILPAAAETVARWREHFTKAGLGDPYVVMAEAFNEGDPSKYGMDAAVGFPPFWAGWALPRLQSTLELFDPKFRGEVVDYEAMASATVAGYHATTAKLFPGVCPSWDNEARKPGRGFCFTGSTPRKYGAWLEAACDMALKAEQPEERLVFINAWNEWAEGAYLEPDRHFGHAYLVETARVLNALRIPGRVASRPAGARSVTHAGPLTGSPGARWRRLARRGALKIADVAEAAARRLQQP
jgi:lipopolysaccharide biosynthesis protein